jgi:hypothetical protein
MQAFMDRHALYAGDAQQIEKIEEFARWAMEQDVIIYDVDAGEIVGAEDAPWAKVGAHVVASAMNIEEEFAQYVAHRLATWNAWGWNVHTLDIEDGWARWRSFYGTSYSTRLLPGESYLNLPLHSREGQIGHPALPQEVKPIFLKLARQRIEDMREYL